jgi:hypothetical protein
MPTAVAMGAKSAASMAAARLPISPRSRGASLRLSGREEIFG